MTWVVIRETTSRHFGPSELPAGIFDQLLSHRGQNVLHLSLIIVLRCENLSNRVPHDTSSTTLRLDAQEGKTHNTAVAVRYNENVRYRKRLRLLLQSLCEGKENDE